MVNTKEYQQIQKDSRVCSGTRMSHLCSLKESILGGVRINSFFEQFFPYFFTECKLILLIIILPFLCESLQSVTAHDMIRDKWGIGTSQEFATRGACLATSSSASVSFRQRDTVEVG
jgi:hypothetical protein